MLYDFIEYEVRLERAQVMSTQSIDGAMIECTQGSLWLTEQGEDDLWLHAGERHVLHGNGRVVIEGLSQAQVRVSPPALARGLSRVSQWWDKLRHRERADTCSV